MCFAPIGLVRSPFSELVGMPLQSVAAADREGVVEIRPELAPGLRDLDGFSHIYLLTWLHCARRDDALELVPFLDDELHGVFATRSPRRPNPIGLSVVRVLAVESRRIRIAGVDLLDGTPVLDIKPYVPAFDHVDADRTGWLEGRAMRVHSTRADDRLSGPR